MVNFNDNELKAIQIIFTMVWQSIFSVVVILAFWKVLHKFLDATNTFDALKYGAIEAFLAGTVYVAFKFWFPT